MPAEYPIAVMDGTCALCAFGAKMVHQLDRTGDIRIAPIQGETGAALMVKHGLDPLDPDRWLFIDEDGTVTRDLDALIRLGRRTGGLGWLLTWLKLFPKPARDWHGVTIASRRKTVGTKSTGRGQNFVQNRQNAPDLTDFSHREFDRNGPLTGFDAYDVVVDATGPFHAYGDDPYCIARAAIAAGTHHFDLCDNAEFY